LNAFTPTVFGVETALRLSFAVHVLMLALLVGLMFVLKLGVFKVGLWIIAWSIWYEHTLVMADNFENIPVAFFNVNAAVSLCMLAFTVGDVLFLQPVNF
jgi:4-hydroxybenzoate polyprenyltransferase